MNSSSSDDKKITLALPAHASHDRHMARTVTVLKCECGRRRSKHAERCQACEDKAADQRYAEAQAHVERGTCPRCGTALVRNLALTGWWQCGAFGELSFRKPEHRSLPHCGFQTFTKY